MRDFGVIFCFKREFACGMPRWFLLPPSLPLLPPPPKFRLPKASIYVCSAVDGLPLGSPSFSLPLSFLGVFFSLCRNIISRIMYLL